MRREPIDDEADSPPRETAGGDPWIVEEMSREDLGAVLAIERRCFPSPWPRSAFEQELKSSYGRCLVARQTAGPARGYVMFWILQDEILINNIAVDPDHRRRGIGGRLLDTALAQGGEARCRIAYLEVRPSNESAIHLYRRRGFEVIGRRRGYYSDTREDALVMRADLLRGGRPVP